MTTWSDVAYGYAPAWLQKVWGAKWSSAIWLTGNALQDTITDAIRARSIRLAPVDALTVHGADRNLPQFPLETSDAYRPRLLNAFTEAGFTTAKVYASRDWPSRGAPWACFWVYFPHPNTLYDPTFRLGDGTTLGSGALLGSFDPTLRSIVAGLVRQWKGAHEQCLGVIVATSGAQLGTGWTLGDGTVLGGESVSFAP